jgi:stage II sporulation protein M
MSRMISDNNFQNKYLGFFIGLYKRNKMILKISVTLFFVPLLIGLFIGYFSSGFTGNFLTFYVKVLHGFHIEINTLSIFKHNLQAALITYFGGIIGIIPAVTLSSNGFIYGAFIGYFTHGGIINNFGVSNPYDFIIYTLPHGIFEISGFIISGAAGFRLTTLVIAVLKRKNPINEHYWKLKDSLALLAIAIVLLFIAATIEANYSISVGNYITGLNLF